jgi:hypothetical protein
MFAATEAAGKPPGGPNFGDELSPAADVSVIWSGPGEPTQDR